MKFPSWIRKTLTFTFANGASGAALTQTKALGAIGELLNIHQVNGNTTNVVTAQVILKDGDNASMFDGTAKAKNASYDHEFGVTIRRILTGDNTISCVISGDPGAGGMTVTVAIYFYGVQ
jgi:hypothetical protein